MSRLYAINDSHGYNMGGIPFSNGVGLCNDANVTAEFVAKGYVEKPGTALTALDKMPEADLQLLADNLGLVRTGLDEKWELVSLLEIYLPKINTVRCATPAATPAAGSVAANATVVLASATAGAKIYYTVNDATPTAESTEYTEPIVIAEAVTIKAIAIKSGYVNSEVLSAAYTTVA